MKIFVSYSRRDAGDFAKHIRSYPSTSHNYEIFTDTDSIRVGETWDTTIETNISNCDIFIVIITHASLKSPHVEKEVLQAQRDKKTIIPCVHGNVELRSVEHTNIQWGLEKIQGIKFDTADQLVRDLFLEIERYQNGQGKK